MYAEVKRLIGLVSRCVNTRPTVEYKKSIETGTAEDTRTDQAEELVSKHETVVSTRNGKSEDLDRGCEERRNCQEYS